MAKNPYPSPADVKPPVTKKSTRYLPYRFNDAELLVIGKELAERTEQLTALESDKKRVVSDFAARVAGKEADISVLTNKIRSGYENRDIPVTEGMHQPIAGRKRIVRDDTNDVVGDEVMSPSELQAELELHDGGAVAASPAL